MKMLLAIGVGLRFWQFSANQALWIDEVALARNILERSWADLLTAPLDFAQVAPPGFLAFEKLLVSVLGAEDYVLRLFPLVSSIVALLIAWRLFPRILDRVGASIALGFLAVAIPLINYSAQVRPYSTDVAVAMLLVSFAVDLSAASISSRRIWLLAVTGAIVVWFSYAGVLVAGGLGAGLAFIAWRSGGYRPVVALMPVLVLWGLASIVVIAAALHNVSGDTVNYMRQSWQVGLGAGSPRDVSGYLWPFRQIVLLFGEGRQASFHYRLPWAYGLLAAAGLAFLWTRRREVALLILCVFGVALAAAIARRYPFSDRLILFLAPLLIVGIASALAWVWHRVKDVAGTAGAAIAVLVLSAPAAGTTVAARPPYWNEDVKPLLSYLQTARTPGDAVYVYYGAAPSVWFHGGDYGLGDGSLTLGGCHRGDNREYLRELDMFRGRSRVWVLMTHAFAELHERPDILSYLEYIGARRLGMRAHESDRAGGVAELYLFDLSDPAKLDGRSAAGFSLSGPDRQPQERTCDGVPSMVADVRNRPRR